MSNQNDNDIQKAVRDYYGSLALTSSKEAPIGCGCSSSESSCCSTQEDKLLNFGIQAYDPEGVKALPTELTNFSLGCGDPVALSKLQPGQTVLDLGSGGGMDCFLAAARVGPQGKVIGVDMTDEMLTKARANQTKLGLENVEFRKGEIENLPVDNGSVDVIISNCVINLSTNKLKVFQEAFRVLRFGGKLAVSDIVTSGQLPEHIIKDLSAWASCISGALSIDEFTQLLAEAGFEDIHIQPTHWDGDFVDTQRQHEPPEGRQSDHSSEILQQSTLTDSQPAIFSAKITAQKPLQVPGQN